MPQLTGIPFLPRLQSVKLWLGALCSNNLLSGTILRVNLAFFSTILLAWAVNGNLDGDLTPFNLLVVHLGDCLLLELLRTESDEAKTPALARFVTSQEFLDHETGDGTEGDLGRDRFVGGKEFL